MQAFSLQFYSNKTISIFHWIFQNFSIHLFYTKPPEGCFWKLKIQSYILELGTFSFKHFISGNHYVNITYRNLEKEQAKLTKVNMNMNQKSVMNVEIIFSGHWKKLEYFSLILKCLNIQKQSSGGVLQKSVLTNFAKFTRKHLFRKRGPVADVFLRILQNF